MRHESTYAEEKNESAHDEDSLENELTTSIVDNIKYHPNMSDITNIQMQLDNIEVKFITKTIEFKTVIIYVLNCKKIYNYLSQQQMNDMQKSEEGTESGLKVPKLKLKLSKTIQNPVESEQSSSESESDSENDGEENVLPEKINSSNEVLSNGKETEQLPFEQSETSDQQHQHEQNNVFLNTGNNNNNYDDSINKSGSSAKNTSDSMEERPAGFGDSDYRTQHENPTLLQDEIPQTLPHQIKLMQDHTSNTESITNTQDTNNIPTKDVCFLNIKPKKM